MSRLRGRYKESKPLFKVLQWIGAVCLFTIIAMVLMVAFQRLAGVSAQNINYLKVVQALQSVGVFLLPPLCVAYLWSDEPYRWLHLQKPSSGAVIWGLVPLSIIVSFPCVNLLTHLNEQLSMPSFLEPLEQTMKEMELRAQELTESFLQVSSVGGLVVNLIVMAFLAAMGEELTFRSLLLNSFTSQSFQHGQVERQASAHIAVWVVAIIFSAFHFQFYGFLPRMLLGAYFGYLLIWTGSVWIPVLAHFTNNAFAVTASYVVYNNDMDTAWLETLGTGETLWVGIVSMVLSVIIILYIRNIQLMGIKSE